MYTITEYLSTIPNESSRETYYYSIKCYLEIVLERKIQKGEIDSVCEEYFAHLAQEHGNSLNYDLKQFKTKAKLKHISQKTITFYSAIMIQYARERGVKISSSKRYSIDTMYDDAHCPTVSEYLSIISIKTTQDTYYHAIKNFLEIILERKIKKENLDSECEKFFARMVSKHGNSFDYALKKYSEKVKTTKLTPRTANFYAHIMLLFAQERGVIVTGKTLRFIRTAFKLNKPTKKNDELDPSTIQKIVETAPLRMKTEIIVMASSGMRIIELLKIVDSDVDFSSSPTTISVYSGYTKSRRLVYLSVEATEALKVWIQERDRLREVGEIDKDDKRVFPYSKSNEIANFRHHIEKCGLLKFDPKTHRSTIHFHQLRKYSQKCNYSS